MLFAFDEHGCVHEGLGNGDKPIAEAVVERNVDEMLTKVSEIYGTGVKSKVMYRSVTLIGSSKEFFRLKLELK